MNPRSYSFRVSTIHHPCSLQTKQASLFYLHSAFCYDVIVCSKICQFFAKCFTLQRPLAHQFQSQLSLPDSSHAVMYASRSKTSLAYFKTTSFFKQQVFQRNYDIAEADMHMSVWCFIMTIYLHRTQNFNSSTIRRNQQH